MSNIIDVDTWKEIVKGKEYLDILKAPTNIQTNKEVLLELLRFHPEQFKINALFNAVKSDPQFMLDAIEIDPTVIEYVSRELLFDNNFKNEVASVSKEAAHILEEEQKRVEMIDTAFEAGEIAVVATVIASDVGILKFMSHEMKDNYELMSLASKENEIVQDYVTLNKGEFGALGIEAVKENIETEAKTIGIEQIKAKRNSEDKRVAKVADKIKEVGVEDPSVIRYMAAMIAVQDEIPTDIANKIYEYSQLQLQTAVTEIPTKENLQKMIPPTLIKDVIEKSGIMSDLPDRDKKLDIYEKNYQKCRNKQKEHNGFDTIPIESVIDATLEVVGDQGIQQKVGQVINQVQKGLGIEENLENNIPERVE